jgi:Zn-dependent M28 family amino/carboxypeptidase
MRRAVLLASTTALVASGLTVLLPAAPASSAACAPGANDTARELLDCVTLEGVREHQAALQAIADANNGTRAAGTPGYSASVAYAKAKLEAAGYHVTDQQFEYNRWEQLLPSTMEVVAPNPSVFVEGQDYQLMQYSGSGDVTAPVQPVDLVLPPLGGSTSGCEAFDFAGFTPGHIALVQRGTCDFSTKAQNASAAGASAVVIFNEGNTPDRTGIIGGTLGTPVDIPVLDATYAAGAAIATIPNTVLPM